MIPTQKAGTEFLVKKKSPNRESIFQAGVKKFLDTLPYTSYIKVQQQAINGNPDIVACIRGYSVHMELKRAGGRAEPLQIHLLKRHRDACGFSFVLSPNNRDVVYNWLKDLAETGIPDSATYGSIDNGLYGNNSGT